MKLAAMLLACYSLSACADPKPDPDTETAEVQSLANPDVAQIIAEHAEQLMAMDDVVAVGEGRCAGQPCIRVLLRSGDNKTINALPASIDGVAVVSEISGDVNASN